MIETRRASVGYSVLRLIEECRNMIELKQIHSQLITSPDLSQTDHYFLITRLLFFCGISNLGSLVYAANIFRFIRNPNLAVYNIMIRAYASKLQDDTGSIQSIFLYNQMLDTGIKPDCLSFPFLVKECTRRLDGIHGRIIHGHIIKFGWHNDLFIQNSLISFYSRLGSLSIAHSLFDEMPHRDIVTWNSLMVAYLRSGDLDAAFELFTKMKKRNIITWNSIITGFVQGGRSREALDFFHQMQLLGDDLVKPDKVTIASILSACASLGAIDHGKWVHSYLKRSEVEFDMVIGTALVDMYGKCGSLERAVEVFDEMPKKDVLAWTAMISAFALHGYSEDAFDLIVAMKSQGVKPNEVTFLGLLSACAHSGLVEKGRWCFDMMRRVYSIQPQAQHYACIVDILGRAGLLKEAYELIKSMPMEPDVYVWGALLGGCQMHGNVELGETVAKHLIDLEPLNHAFYVNLCDIYGKANKFDNAKRIRALMNENGIKKEFPGCSMIELDGIVYDFSIKGSPEIVMDEINWVLIGLCHQMKINRDISHCID